MFLKDNLMKLNFTFCRCTMVILILGSLCAGSVSSASVAETPAAFISNIVWSSIRGLTEKNVSDNECAARFRAIIHESFAVELAGKWILGKYWKQASEVQRVEFMNLFEGRIVSHNVAHFKKFNVKDVQFNVRATRMIGDRDVLVKTDIGGKDGGKLISMDWRVIRRNNRYWVFDVTVAGMSMAKVHQAEYRSLISKNGGDISVLLNALKQQQ